MTYSQQAACNKAIEKLRGFIQMQGCSLETERSYCRSVRKFIEFLYSRRWPGDSTSERKAEVFLTSEAKRGVSASTQNGSFHAICYYYRHIRKAPLVNVDALRARVGEHVCAAPPRDELRKFLMALSDSGPYPTRLIGLLQYACGLRPGETLAIRLKDIDLDAGRLTIVEGKGKKDRFINLPPMMIAPLRIQVAAAESVWMKAKSMGVPVKLPNRYAKKSPSARFQKRWFFLFPMVQPCMDPRGEGRVWWHCLSDTLQRAFRTANKRAGTEGITPHDMRRAWATHAHQDGACMRDIQEIMGHRDVRTTMRYIRPDPERVPSPLETIGIRAS